MKTKKPFTDFTDSLLRDYKAYKGFNPAERFKNKR